MTQAATCPERAECEYAIERCAWCPLTVSPSRRLRQRAPRHVPLSYAMSDPLVLFHDENRLNFVKYVRSRRLDAHDAQDVVNEAFLILHRKRDEFAACDNPSAFAFKILTNCVADYTRRLDRRPMPIDVTQDHGHEWLPDDPSETVIVRVDLERAIDALPTRQAECLRLHYFVGLPTGEIARYLEISQSAVTTHLLDGRRRLEAGLVGYRTSKEVNTR